MNYMGAVVKVNTTEIAIIIVEGDVINDINKARELNMALKDIFPDNPVILMSKDGKDRPTFFGRPDMTELAKKMDLSKVSWQEYTL